MSETTVKVPGPDRPITVALRESTYRPVHSIPRRDVDMDAPPPFRHHEPLPLQGPRVLFQPAGRAGRARCAVWTYETPHDAVAAIKGHRAFTPDRVGRHRGTRLTALLGQVLAGSAGMRLTTAMVDPPLDTRIVTRLSHPPVPRTARGAGRAASLTTEP